MFWDFLTFILIVQCDNLQSKKKRAGMADFFRNGLDGRWGMGMGKSTIYHIGKIAAEIIHILNFANTLRNGNGVWLQSTDVWLLSSDGTHVAGDYIIEVTSTEAQNIVLSDL